MVMTIFFASLSQRAQTYRNCQNTQPLPRYCRVTNAWQFTLKRQKKMTNKITLSVPKPQYIKELASPNTKPRHFGYLVPILSICIM
jgi:hypothetical protein